MIIQASRASLKNMDASDFQDGDVIITKEYMIYILYGNYKRPTLKSYVENRKTHKILDYTPGVPGGWPYYIADFLHR